MDNEKGLDFNLVSKEVETIPPKLPDFLDLKNQALEIYESARGVTIKNDEELNAAKVKLVVTRKIIKSFKDLLNPGIVAAKATLDILKDKRTGIIDPLTAAENAVKMHIGKYEQAAMEERQRVQAEEDRRIAEARKKEREAMAEMAKAERAGDMEKADKIMEEHVKIEEENAIIQPTAKQPEKVKEVSTRMIPKWEVINASLLPKVYRTIVPINPKITGLVRAHGPKEAMRICPGIRAWEEPSVTVRG